MTPMRQSRWVSAFVVAVAAFAWLVASNHCAFAAFEKPRPAAHACCHEEGKSSSPSPGAAMQCCDTFNVMLPGAAAVPAVSFGDLRPEWTGEISRCVAVSILEGRPFCSHGPPRAAGFAETVLNRSLPSHGPPLLVA